MTAPPLFRTILLVEDDASHALLIKRALKDYADEVAHHEDLKGCYAALADGSYRPDLIITDLRLPDSVRIEHVHKLQAAGGGAPVVVLTSSTSLVDAVEAMKLGAKDFVVKNFSHDFRELLGVSLSRLHSLLALEREKAAVQRRIELLQSAIENSHDGFAVVLQGGGIEYSNSAFRAFAELCGGMRENLLQIFSPGVNKQAMLLDDLQRKLIDLPAGAVWSTEITFQDRKETAFDLSLSAVREEGGLKECVVWARDISEQKRREKFQREILSTTTHDLKGPLGAILISSDLIGSLAPAEPKVGELALRINSLAQNTVNLIDEFLSARRIQEGTFILKPASFQVATLIETALENYRSTAAAKRITLAFEPCPPELMAKVDKFGFERVLGNLLSNALKFTPREGSVTVRAFVREDELHVQISDTGSGMEPAEVQLIFRRFSRLARHENIAGSGIGLFVVKSIVAAHGGRIEVTSQIGRGTTFDVSFPLNPPVNERGELISLDFA